MAVEKTCAGPVASSNWKSASERTGHVARFLADAQEIDHQLRKNLTLRQRFRDRFAVRHAFARLRDGFLEHHVGDDFLRDLQRRLKERYLDVTFRKGKVMTAYFYLPRNPGEKSQRTEQHGEGILIDYSKDGRPIGIEFTVPDQISALLQQLNQVLTQQNVAPIQPIELFPLLAA